MLSKEEFIINHHIVKKMVMLNIKKIINILIVSPIKYLKFKIVSIYLSFQQRIYSYFFGNDSECNQYERSLIHPLYTKVPVKKYEIYREKIENGISIFFIYDGDLSVMYVYNNGNVEMLYPIEDISKCEIIQYFSNVKEYYKRNRYDSPYIKIEESEIPRIFR